MLCIYWKKKKKIKFLYEFYKYIFPWNVPSATTMIIIDMQFPYNFKVSVKTYPFKDSTTHLQISMNFLLQVASAIKRILWMF